MNVERKFLKNDLVTIANRESSAHGFEIGERVKLTREDGNDGWVADKLDSSDFWLITNEEIELGFQEGDLVKVREYEELCEEFNADLDGDFYFDSHDNYMLRSDIEEANEYDEVLEVVEVGEYLIYVKDEDGHMDEFFPEILEFAESQKQTKENEDGIKVGSIVRGLPNSSYIITGSGMAEGIVVSKVEDNVISVTVLKHTDQCENYMIDQAIKEKKEYLVDKKYFELVRQSSVEEELKEEIKVGSIVRGIKDKYTYTNTKMTEGLVTKVEGDSIYFIMLDHDNKNTNTTIRQTIELKVEFCLPTRDFEFVRQEEVKLIEEVVNEAKEEEPYIPFKVTITSDGKTTNCTYEENGKVKEVQARLHPDDKFDFKTGVGLCIERAFDDSIKEGEVVKVIRSGAIFSMYSDWLIDNNVSLDIACKFCYGSTDVRMDKEYKVIKKARHSEGYFESNKQQLLLIQDKDKNVYLISEDGVKRVEK